MTRSPRPGHESAIRSCCPSEQLNSPLSRPAGLGYAVELNYHSTSRDRGCSVNLHGPQSHLEAMGMDGINGHPPTLFPRKLKPEEHLTSRLMAVLIAVRPFRLRFFEHTRQLSGRRPTAALQRSAQVRAIALLEPSLNRSNSRRADAAISIRNGSRGAWRCVIEVKYLSDGRKGKESKQSLNRAQIERTYEDACQAKFNHMLTISHETAVNGLNPSGFSPHSEAGGPTLAHLSWLEIVALLQRTIEEDSQELDPAALAILRDLAGYLRASNIWEHANNVSLGRSAFAIVRGACRGNQLPHQDAAETVEALNEVLDRWKQFAAASANAMTAVTGVIFRPRTASKSSLARRVRRTSRLELELITSDPEVGSIECAVDIRERLLETAWVVDVAGRSPTQKPRTATRWHIVREALKERPPGTNHVDVVGVDGKSIVGGSSVPTLLRALERRPALQHEIPTSIRFVRAFRMSGRSDLTSNNITPQLNSMLLKTLGR